MINEGMLDNLREELSEKMSAKRYRHTLEVEKMAERLGGLYAPEKIPVLRAAALLHDLTKEYSPDRQLAICAQKDLPLDRSDLYAVKTLHAMTAAAVIPEQYPDLADEEILACVRWHTTGHGGMTLCEQLIYLADYIDMSRTFEDCVTLRDFFFDAHPEKMNAEERLAHLRDTMILSFDMTIRGLLESGKPISIHTMDARNELICERLDASRPTE